MKLTIKILGTGCARCNTLATFTEEVVREYAYDIDIQKIGNINQILKYKVMSTPALVINEIVVASGRVPSKEEIRSFIEKTNPVN